MKIFTIGFTQSSAQRFFERLRSAGVKRLLDVRLNNVSQLSGFAKRDDLRYFAAEICRIDYEHLTDLAPTQDMLDDYKKHRGLWDLYDRRFTNLMAEREIERMDKDRFDHGCLLCSEHEPHHCHRRLVAEYLRQKWSDVEIQHL